LSVEERLIARMSSAERRGQLVAAARIIALSEGVDAVTVRRVVTAAGASIASFHYVFDDKEELLGAVSNELLRGYEGALSRHVPTGAGLGEAIQGVLTGYWQWVNEEPGLTRVILDAALSSKVDSGPSAVDVGHALVLDVLRATGEQPTQISLDDLAHVILVVIDGLSVIDLVTQDPTQSLRNLENTTRALVALAGA